MTGGDNLIHGEPIIASLTDPEAGIVEHLLQAQKLINERDAYKRACELCCQDIEAKCGDTYEPEYWYELACKELESENIQSGKVC